MKLKLLIASLLFCFIASAQINDPNVLRNYINANVIPNNTRNVTAQQLNNILNGQLNVMQIADIDSFATSPTFDTLFIYQHNAAGQKVRKGYHIGGNFDTSHINDRLNALNTTKLNASDSLNKYVTPSQLQAISGGNVYHPGDNIVQISGSAISIDTITGVPTKNYLFANFPPKTRTINNKALTGNIQLNKSDFPDLNVVDNTSDMDKPLSNKQRDSLLRKVDKTTTVNGKSLSGNITISQDDIGLSNADNTRDIDKPVSNATRDSLNASTFQKSLIRGSDLNRDNTVNAGEYQFNIAAKTVSIKGKGMTTKFGVIQNPNNNTNLLASLVGTGVVRSGYTFTAANATPMLILLNNGYEVVVNLNAIAQDSSRGFLSVAELPQYRKTLDSLFTYYFTGRNAHVFFNMNEQFNKGYYVMDSLTWSKYVAMQFVFDSVVHAHGGLTADGGLTAEAMKWLPYKDLLDQGRTDDANEYAQSEFTALQIAGGLNWDVTGPYKLQIYLTRQWLNAIKNNSTDFINLHWKTPTNGINSDTINIRPFQWAVQYYARTSGKPVISNELGSKSTKPYIAKQLFKAATDLNFYLAIWYSGTGTTFNAEDINLLNGSALSPVGSGVKGSLDTANNSQRIAMTVQDGKVSYPGVGMGSKLPAYFDENNNLVPGPATVGMIVDTPAINQAIARKAEKDTTIKLRTDVNGKLDSLKKSITTKLSILRILANPQADVIYQTFDYGGGQWYYDSTDNTTADNTAFTIVTSSGKRLKRIWNGVQANINWMSANPLGDSTTNTIPFFNKLKALMKSGGEIYFPKGNYMGDATGWRIDTSNITLRGAGVNATYFRIPTGTNIGLVLAPYRDAGWKNKDTDIVTFVDTSAIVTGQQYLDLKVAADTARIPVGTVVYLSMGAHYFDQYFGEFNKVIYFVNNSGTIRAYFEKPFKTDYTQARSSNGGSTTASFVTPADGSTVTVAYTAIATPNANVLLTIGTNLYKVVSATSTSMVLTSVAGKGNSAGITVTSGAAIFKYRGIVNAASTVQNTIIRDLTIDGARTSLNISNTYNTLFENFRMTWRDNGANGGLWIDGDGGRAATFNNCEFTCQYIFPSQFGRNFSDAKFYKCTFNQAPLAFSEFTNNYEVSGCTFNIKQTGQPGESAANALQMGNTTSEGYVHDNVFNVAGLSGVVTATDIQNITNLGTKGNRFERNTLNMSNIGQAISITGFGNNTIKENILTGSARVLYNMQQYSFDTSYQRDVSGRFGYGTKGVVSGNSFVGNCNSFMVFSDNVEYTNNTVNRFGSYQNNSSFQTADDAAGNIINGATYYDSTLLNYFVMRNNQFISWNYLSNSFYLQHPLSQSVDISGNKFFHQTGSFDYRKDFVVSINDPNRVAYQTADFIPVVQNISAEKKAYYNLVSSITDHAIATQDKAGIDYLLGAIYANNLRYKLGTLYPLPTDATIAKVPLIGGYNGMYQKAVLLNNTGDTAYNKTLKSFVGNGSSTVLVLGLLNNAISTVHGGLFVQLTKQSSATAQTFAGSYTGASGHNQLELSFSTTNAVKGAGGANIQTGLSGGALVGGYYTGVGSYPEQTNMYSNTTSGTNTLASNYQNTPINTTTQLTVLGQWFGTPAVQNYSDAGVGLVATFTTNLTPTEALKFAQIVRNYDSIVGKPYQASNPFPGLYTGSTIRKMSPSGVDMYAPDTLVSGGAAVTYSVSKNATRDSTVLTGSDGSRSAVKDSTGTGTGSSTYSGLTDVNNVSLANNDFSKYNTTTGKWENFGLFGSAITWAQLHTFSNGLSITSGNFLSSVSLLPATAGNRNIGSTTLGWQYGYFNTGIMTSANTSDLGFGYGTTIQAMKFRTGRWQFGGTVFADSGWQVNVLGRLKVKDFVQLDSVVKFGYVPRSTYSSTIKIAAVNSDGTLGYILPTDLPTGTGSGLDPTHPVSSGSTPTVSSSAGAAISSISISGTDAAMKLTFVIPTGQSVNGYVGTITYSSAWSAAPKASITPSMDATNYAAIGTQIGAGEETTTTFKVRAYSLTAGTYTYTIKSMQ